MGLEVVVEGLGQAKVGYLGLEVAPVQEYVGRLHIPVDQRRRARLVQVLKACTLHHQKKENSVTLVSGREEKLVC